MHVCEHKLIFIKKTRLIAVFLILVLYGTFVQDRSFWCKIIFCELIKSLTRK